MLKKPLTSSELNGYGEGLPFFIPERYPILRNDFQRQQPIYIDLADLNEGQGMPKNFTDKRGRILPSYERYWTALDFQVAVNYALDIE